MPRAPVKITASLNAHAGKAQELLALLLEMAPKCRAEPGNLRWDIWRDIDQPERYVLDELYLDVAAAAAHRQTPHYQDYLVKVPTLADRSALILEAVAIS